MIDEGEKSYERFARLVENEGPSEENTKKLAEAALRKNNRGALAALGLHNIKWTIQAARELGEDPDRVISSLSGGPGSNLLVQWFTHRDAVPDGVKESLRRLARDVLVQYAVGLGKELIGDRSRGVLEGETLRSYIAGDDPSLIDLEETVENVVMQGKAAPLVSTEDFTVRETIHGRRAVALLVDISGSMQGEKLTWCSIAAAMLAYALRPDELALAFFESDTHVVKSFTDKMEIEEIADELLNLRSRGGTMLNAGLDWMTEQLRQIGHRRKNALVLTDAGIFDLEECAGGCRMLSALHSSVTWFVPEADFDQSQADVLAKWSQGSMVRLHQNWKQFPMLIREALK
jgi:Mg-chelatase subunit ChlD